VTDVLHLDHLTLVAVTSVEKFYKQVACNPLLTDMVAYCCEPVRLCSENRIYCQGAIFHYFLQAACDLVLTADATSDWAPRFPGNGLAPAASGRSFRRPTS